VATERGIILNPFAGVGKSSKKAKDHKAHRGTGFVSLLTHGDSRRAGVWRNLRLNNRRNKEMPGILRKGMTQSEGGQPVWFLLTTKPGGGVVHGEMIDRVGRARKPTINKRTSEYTARRPQFTGNNRRRERRGRNGRIVNNTREAWPRLGNPAEDLIQT